MSDTDLKFELTPYGGIATQDGYEQAAIALHDLMSKKKSIEDFFAPKIQAAHLTHKAMLELQAMFLGPFLDLEKTIKQDMATWKEQQKELERLEREKHEKILQAIKTQLESVLNEGIDELKKNTNFDYTELLSKGVMAVIENNELSRDYRMIVDQKALEIAQLFETTKESLIKKQMEKQEGVLIETPFEEQTPTQTEQKIAIDMVVERPAPASEQKTKGITTYKDVEILIVDEKMVPIEFAGKIIRPVDIQAIKQLAKAIGEKFELPGVKAQFVEKIKSSGRL